MRTAERIEKTIPANPDFASPEVLLKHIGSYPYINAVDQVILGRFMSYCDEVIRDYNDAERHQDATTQPHNFVFGPESIIWQSTLTPKRLDRRIRNDLVANKTYKVNTKWRETWQQAFGSMAPECEPPVTFYENPIAQWKEIPLTSFTGATAKRVYLARFNDAFISEPTIILRTYNLDEVSKEIVWTGDEILEGLELDHDQKVALVARYEALNGRNYSNYTESDRQLSLHRNVDYGFLPDQQATINPAILLCDSFSGCYRQVLKITSQK
jgi:hypothetical protein